MNTQIPVPSPEQWNALPDVAVDHLPPAALAIDWVGMTGLAIPCTYQSSPLQLSLDISVDLPTPHAKGIHMSRLYNLALAHLSKKEITPVLIRQLLKTVIDSHADLGTFQARLTFSANVLLERTALVSNLRGYKFYPITLEATTNNRTGTTKIEISACVDYSSTCPCSAALSRQLLKDKFLADWNNKPLNKESIADWLNQHGSYATPHSQRSQAKVTIPVYGNDLGIVELINQIEGALGTPVQTAVKRVDEQAFARLNGSNLMYVEDAVRRLHAAMIPLYPSALIQVFHRESLHQHDAVATSFHSIR